RSRPGRPHDLRTNRGTTRDRRAARGGPAPPSAQGRAGPPVPADHRVRADPAADRVGQRVLAGDPGLLHLADALERRQRAQLRGPGQLPADGGRPGLPQGPGEHRDLAGPVRRPVRGRRARLRAVPAARAARHRGLPGRAVPAGGLLADGHGADVADPLPAERHAQRPAVRGRPGRLAARLAGELEHRALRPDRSGALARDRLCHGAVSSRPQGHRPGALRGGQDGRRLVLAAVPARDPPSVAQRQRGSRLGHHHRLAAFLRRRLVADPGRPVQLLAAAEHLHVPDRFREHRLRLRLRPGRRDLRARVRRHRQLPDPRIQGERLMAATVPQRPAAARRPLGKRLRTLGFHTGASALSLLWFLPIALILVISFRSTDDVLGNGLNALPHSFAPGNYSAAWSGGGMQQALINSAIVSIPAVLLTLLLASMAAFALSRYRIPLRRTLILLMLGGNLLPPQILLVPVAKLSQVLGFYDSLPTLIAVEIGFGLGFYVFVLQGFMRTIPAEIQQAALLDGAGPFQIYWRIVLPLTRPALAALGALSFTWVFNDL